MHSDGFVQHLLTTRGPIGPTVPDHVLPRVDRLAADRQPAPRASTCCAPRTRATPVTPRPSSPARPGSPRPRSPTSCASCRRRAWSTPSPAAAGAATRSQLARAAGLVAGIDFGHSHVAVARRRPDRAAARRGAARASTPATDHDEALAAATTMLDRLLARGWRGRCATSGLGLPAPVTDDVVRSSAIFPGWEGVNARGRRARRFGAPVARRERRQPRAPSPSTGTASAAATAARSS